MARSKPTGEFAPVTGRKIGVPKSHHLDRRASVIADKGEGDADDLLTSRQVADWLNVAEQWVETGRQKNYGPPFTRLSSRVIRYKRSDVLAWLRARKHACTAEYTGA